MDGASQNPNRKGRESYARPFSGLRLWPKSKATRLCDCPMVYEINFTFLVRIVHNNEVEKGTKI